MTRSATPEVHHIGLTVSDFDPLAAMLEDLFCFHTLVRGAPPDKTIVARITGVPGAQAEIALLSNGMFVIELLRYFAPDDRSAVTLRPCDVAFAHLAFMTGDLDELSSRMAGYGFQPMQSAALVTVGPNVGRRAVYLQNADGVTIELIQPAPPPVESAG